MNEKLKQEIHGFIYNLISKRCPEANDVFIKECDWEDDIRLCAEHFYNLANMFVSYLISFLN